MKFNGFRERAIEEIHVEGERLIECARETIYKIKELDKKLPDYDNRVLSLYIELNGYQNQIEAIHWVMGEKTDHLLVSDIFRVEFRLAYLVSIMVIGAVGTIFNIFALNMLSGGMIISIFAWDVPRDLLRGFVKRRWKKGLGLSQVKSPISIMEEMTGDEN